MINKIKQFTDLDAWREGHKLVLLIYKITQKYPKEEIFSLTSQTRRAVVSITCNIAEGFSRRSYKDKIHFYVIAAGSLTELQNQLIIARDIHYLPAETFPELVEQTVKVQKVVNGLIRKSKIIQDS
jgi:four helix bundle protein